MPALVTEAGRLQQDLVEGWKEIENCGAKPESIKEAEDEIVATKKKK